MAIDHISKPDRFGDDFGVGSPETGGWMDIWCKCENNTYIIQMNDDNDKIKIICTKCESEETLNIEKVSIESE